MSNRQRLRPPATARVAAANSRCTHCGATGRITGLDAAGAWVVKLSHDPGCPRVTGHAGADRAMLLQALEATREFHRTTGGAPRELVLHDPHEPNPRSSS